MADKIPETTAALLRQLQGTNLEGVAEGTPSPAYEAQTKLFAKTQYAFYVSFQALVLVLGVAVLTALVIFIIRLVDGVDVTGVVGILGSVATGLASGFLQKEANAAKKRYEDALKVLAGPA